ncbi:hypothetical protein F4780DRAFT_726592 [Xylariomycetidae sp. FL0641]|nr:hypothetical protein F4780DRAFT_726592 [Xylariomycetidae sp. FL0641]
MMDGNPWHGPLPCCYLASFTTQRAHRHLPPSLPPALSVHSTVFISSESRDSTKHHRRDDTRHGKQSDSSDPPSIHPPKVRASPLEYRGAQVQRPRSRPSPFLGSWALFTFTRSYRGRRRSWTPQAAALTMTGTGCEDRRPGTTSAAWKLHKTALHAHAKRQHVRRQARARRCNPSTWDRPSEAVTVKGKATIPCCHAAMLPRCHAARE